MKPVTCVVILTIVAALAACASQVPGTAPEIASDSPPKMVLVLNNHRLGQNDVVHIAHPEVLHLPFGYYRIVVNGQDRFCHKENFTGSRVQTSEECLTKKQLDSIDDNKRQQMQQIQNWGTTCVYHTPGTGGGMGHCEGGYGVSPP